MRFEGNVGHADEADEFAGGAEFGGKESEAVPDDVRLNAVDHTIALRGRERRGKELHDARVGIDELEGLAVALLPGAEEQTGRLEHGYFSLRVRDRGQTGLPANFRQTAPEIHGSLVSPRRAPCARGQISRKAKSSRLRTRSERASRCSSGSPGDGATASSK